MEACRLSTSRTDQKHHAGIRKRAGEYTLLKVDAVLLQPRHSREARLITTGKGWRLGIPAGGPTRYRVSQLDDQRGLARHSYLWQPPLTLNLLARVSSVSPPGTWGFGFWNDPYGFSFGPGDKFLRLPALPQAAWFFAASPRNYLSFRDDRPANGFLAQTFRSPRFHPSLIGAALAFPFAPTTTRKLLRQFIAEDAATVQVDPTQWHAYRLIWSDARCVFSVDGAVVLRTAITPTAPLGLVIWIDNQYAAFDPNGTLRWGMEENLDEIWLEIESLQLEAGSPKSGTPED